MIRHRLLLTTLAAVSLPPTALPAAAQAQSQMQAGQSGDQSQGASQSQGGGQFQGAGQSQASDASAGAGDNGKSYPTCSATVTDGCMQRGGGSHHAKAGHRAGHSKARKARS